MTITTKTITKKEQQHALCVRQLQLLLFISYSLSSIFLLSSSRQFILISVDAFVIGSTSTSRSSNPIHGQGTFHRKTNRQQLLLQLASSSDSNENENEKEKEDDIQLQLNSWKSSQGAPITQPNAADAAGIDNDNDDYENFDYTTFVEGKEGIFVDDDDDDNNDDDKGGSDDDTVADASSSLTLLSWEEEIRELVVGLTEKELQRIVARVPEIKTANDVNNARDTITKLKSKLQLTDLEVKKKIVLRLPQVVGLYNYETQIQPGFQSLQQDEEGGTVSLQLTDEELKLLILKCPQIIGLDYSTEIEPSIHSIIESEDCEGDAQLAKQMILKKPALLNLPVRGGVVGSSKSPSSLSSSSSSSPSSSSSSSPSPSLPSSSASLSSVSLSSPSLSNNKDVVRSLDDSIMKRYACTRYQKYDGTYVDKESPTLSIINGDPIVIQKAKEALKLALRSPTGFNVQPYKLLMIKTPSAKKKLAKYCIGRNKDRVLDSDCTIVFLADRQIMRSWHQYKSMIGQQGKIKSRWSWLKLSLLTCMFSSGFAYLPKVLSGPLSFGMRLAMRVVSWFGRSSLVVPTLSSPECWSQKNTALVAMTYMLACTSRNLATTPMEGYLSWGIRQQLQISRRYTIPLIVSTGIPYQNENKNNENKAVVETKNDTDNTNDNDNDDDAGISHGNTAETSTPRFSADTMIVEM